MDERSTTWLVTNSPSAFRPTDWQRFIRVFNLLLSLMLWVACENQLGAQPMQIQHLTVKDGLSQSSPYHMLTDSRGFLWLGTQDGVNRYDGHRFRVYKPDVRDAHSLRGVNVAGIVEDKQGNIWVGTEEGLNRYDRASDRFSLIRTSSRKRRTSPFHATGQEIWFSSEGEGLMVYNFKTGKLRRIGKYAHINRDFDFVDWTTYTPTGDIWILYRRGVARFSLRDKNYHPYFTDTPLNEYGEPRTVYCLAVDQDDIAWLGTDRGLVRFDHRRKQHQFFEWASGSRPLGVVYSVADDGKGRLWLGTRRNGLWIFDKKTHKFQEVHYRDNSPESFENYEFYRIYADKSGIIWANADPDGLVKIVPDASMFGYFGQANPLHPERNLSDLSIRSIAEDGRGRIWVGTEGGLDIFDREKGIVQERYFTSDDNILKYIFKDSKQRMWVGTYGGIMLFEKGTRTFRPFRYDTDPSTRLYTRNILELPDHTLLLGTAQGMWLFDPDQRTFSRVPFHPDQNIYATFLDSGGTLWLGSYFDRIYAYQLHGKHWKKTFEGFKDFNINAIREDTARRRLWIATEKGLLAFNRTTGTYRLYDEKDGFANTYMYGVITTPDGNVFASTNHGISSLNPATGHVRNFDLSDGLQGYEFNGNAFFQSSTGECFFGGVKGLNFFFPRQFPALAYQPRIHFFNFKVNEEPYDLSRNVDEMSLVTLPQNQNTFSLEFASIDYYSNGKNTYKYLLHGQDQDWVQAGDRTYVRYANLEPGTYVFKVKSANRDGVWNKQERTLSLVITPPFWRTWWFSALYLIVIAGGTFAIAQGRLKRIGRQQQQRLKIALDAQEQERRNIAQDLHDEVGSRLATLKLYVSSLTRYLKESADAERLKTEVMDIIQISLVDIRRLLRELSPRTLEQYGYAAAVEELVNRINAANQIHVTFECRKLSDQLSKTLETGLYRITQELLNNTLKHADATEITISVIPSGKAISFYYSDNGRGFDYPTAKRGLGIGNIRSRVVVLEGQMKWFTKPGQGLEVTIELPIRS